MHSIKAAIGAIGANEVADSGMSSEPVSSSLLTFRHVNLSRLFATLLARAGLIPLN